MSTQVKNQLIDIMLQAWSFVKRNGMSMAEAIKVAWLNYKVRKEMASRIVKFWFIKISGEIREAYGTLISDIILQTAESGRMKNDTLQVYNDCEKAAWRCLRMA